jgi:hypothetical protein
MPFARKTLELTQLTAVLLLAAGLRILRLVEFVEWPDEIYTLWRSQGSLRNLLTLTPNDWPPLYGVIHWIWVQFTGPTLEASRYLMVLVSLVGIALMYQAARALFSFVHSERSRFHRAALLSAVLFATMGYSIFAGVDLRAYGLLLMLGALGIWLTVHWMQKPSRPRAAGVALLIAVMFYTSFTSAAFVALLTVLVIVMRPRLFFRWVGIGIGVLLLTLPIMPQFYEYGPGRVGGVMDQPVPPFFEAMVNIFRDFGGPSWFLGVVLLLVIAGIAQAARGAFSWRILGALGVWLAFPLFTYFILDNREFLKPRYMWWVALGLTLFAGLVATRLQRALVTASIGAALLLPLVPVDFDNYRLWVTASPPFRMVFSWFAEHLRPGDVLIIDPNCACGVMEGWDYFVPQYFPTGYLPVVERPGNASRVWYLSTSGARDEALLREIETGREPSIFVGPWHFLLRLYEGPPDWEGVPFDNKIRLHGVEILDTGTVIAQNERFQVKLWWSADQPLDLDYSMSVAVRDRFGRIIAQADGPVHVAGQPKQTSTWEPSEIYQDIRTLQLPRTLSSGPYTLYVTVYQWWDGTRLLPEENSLWPVSDQDNTVLEVQEIYVVGTG